MSTEETPMAKVQRQRADFEKALEVALTNCDALEAYKRWAEEVAKPALEQMQAEGAALGGDFRGPGRQAAAALLAYPPPEKETKEEPPIFAHIREYDHLNPGSEPTP